MSVSNVTGNPGGPGQPGGPATAAAATPTDATNSATATGGLTRAFMGLLAAEPGMQEYFRVNPRSVHHCAAMAQRCIMRVGIAAQAAADSPKFTEEFLSPQAVRARAHRRSLPDCT
jgi:hypothetical protein